MPYHDNLVDLVAEVHALVSDYSDTFDTVHVTDRTAKGDHMHTWVVSGEYSGAVGRSATIFTIDFAHAKETAKDVPLGSSFVNFLRYPSLNAASLSMSERRAAARSSLAAWMAMQSKRKEEAPDPAPSSSGSTLYERLLADDD